MSRLGAALAAGALLLAAGCGSGEHRTAVAPPRPTPASTDTAPAGSSDPSLAACPAPAARAQPSAGAKTLPNVTLPCLAGGPAVDLVRMTGAPTVVNVWASWCAPCRAETPALQAFSTRAGAKVRVVGVASTDQSQARSREFLRSAGAHYAVLYDESGRVRDALGLVGLPGTALVRADGSIAKVIVGPVTTRSLIADVQRYLGVAV